ncbi:hypothetical protein [Rhizobium mongolense]|uniref:Uncharacterized protein n=2 Tax=Rhizobium mongolense TaxID=57676 RepID=A0ABR6IEE3_9HYPH|nr:hypothetical protein [Rhizobium mongolense]MBB4226238.1 hypothetical protein [Rhizobium mongolense]
MQRKANCSEELMCDDYPLIAGTASIAENFAEFSSRLALSMFAGRGRSSGSTALSITSRRRTFRRAGGIDILHHQIAWRVAHCQNARRVTTRSFLSLIAA